MRRKPAVGTILASRGSLASVRNAATALLQPIMEAADTARIRLTVAATAETVPFPAINPARPMVAAADTARVLPTAEATAETVPCPTIAPARHTREEAGTSPAVLLAAGARSARAAAPTAAAVVNNEFSHVVVRGPKHRMAPTDEPRPVRQRP